jgi:hypothetical protein
MANLRTTALVASLLLALARLATAQEGVVVRDFGTASCGYWLDVRANRSITNDARFVQAREWVSGFISAFNWYMRPPGGDVAQSTDREGMYAWLDLYCREHPTVGLAKAVEQLVEHLGSR